MEQRTNFAWPSTSINREDYEVFCDWFDKNEAMLRCCQLVIWGAGIRGTIFSLFLKRKNYNNIVFVDGNSEKWGGCVNEFPILSPEELEEQRNNSKRVILVATENSADIERELEERKYCKGIDYFVIRTGLYDKYVEEFKRGYNNRILVMGDCEFSTMAAEDKDYRTLAELLTESFGREEVKVLAMHGMGLRAFYNVFCAQVDMGMKPELLFVMVNFDTLTGKQHLLPRSQHAELIQKIYDGLEEKSEEFTAYVQAVWERNKSIQAEFFTVKEDKKENTVTDAKAKNYFRLNYLYRLDMETEGVLYLIKILDKATKEGVKVIPFIPPVNYQLGESLFGEKFKTLYEQNVEKIRMLLEEKGVGMLDLSYSLTADMFADRRTPDETANDVGRKTVASIMETCIKKALNCPE